MDIALSNFMGRPKTLSTGLSVPPISRDAHSWKVATSLASEVGYTGKTIDRRRLAPDSLMYPLPTTLLIVFSCAMFFCQDVTDHCTLAGNADSPLFVCRDHSTPPLLGSKHGMGSLGFHWWYADNVGV